MDLRHIVLITLEVGGVKIQGDFALTQGQVLNILVGGKGGNSKYSGGGGGGTYIIDVH